MVVYLRSCGSIFDIMLLDDYYDKRIISTLFRVKLKPKTNKGYATRNFQKKNLRKHYMFFFPILFTFSQFFYNDELFVFFLRSSGEGLGHGFTFIKTCSMVLFLLLPLMNPPEDPDEERKRKAQEEEEKKKKKKN